MAFKDFKHRVSVVDVRPCRDWVERNVKVGHWAMMNGGWSLYSATYCFEYEEDALAFKLVHAGSYASSQSQ